MTKQWVVRYSGIIIARTTQAKAEAYAKRMNEQAPQYNHTAEEEG